MIDDDRLAGLRSVGAGGDLIPAAAMAAGDWSGITATAVTFADAIARTRNDA